MVCSIIIFMGHPEAHGHFRAGKERQGKGQCVCTLPLNCFSAVQRGMKSTGEMQSRGRLIWTKSRVKASSQDGLAHVCLVKMALCSVTCDSLWLHGLQHTRLLCPWNSPGKNTGVGCHFLLNAWKWKVKVKSLSHAWLLETPLTAAYQAPPSMGFSRQEYWSGLPLPSPLLGTRYCLKHCTWLDILNHPHELRSLRYR